MRKLNLVALSYDRDAILNALQRTNAVEIREHAEVEGTSALPEGGEALRAYLAALEDVLSTLEAAPESYGSGEGTPRVKDGFAVTYEEFSKAAENREWADALVSRVHALTGERSASLTEQASLTRAIAAAKPYAQVPLPFNVYTGTQHVAVRLGLLPLTAWDSLQKSLDELPLVAYEETKGETDVLLVITAHRCAISEVEEFLSGANFSPCPYKGDFTGAEQLARLEGELAAAKNRQQVAETELVSLAQEIRTLKIYCDYVGFELEKAEAAGKMRGTERTFFLQAYVPADEEEKVKTALDGTMSAIWYEFSDPAEDEAVPTLLKNNKVVANFETITNMYSPPNSRELDPNTVMSFFYSLFMGFIMADIGYGIVMLLGGGLLYKKTKGGGLKSLSGVFAICGIFTIFWGVLFNSLFGIAVLPFTVMPDARSAMYTLAGISLPAVLLISLLLGIIQLMAGYLCKAALSIARGHIWDAILDGGVWAMFSLGAELAVIGLIQEFELSGLVMVGGILAGASLVIAMLTAGRRERAFGKVKKGFAALYSIINYFTDVMSYIRLYGLMLTGAIIAQIVSDYSIQFMVSGSWLVVLGPVLMVVGHIFNLAIGLLGAYIHTARLQYVEFFGRFYEGDGQLFTPLGSKKKYINLEKAA